MNSLKRSNKLYNDYERYLLKVVDFRKPVLSKAYGCYYEDVDGNKYLDLMAGQFSAVFGHSYRPLNELIKKQLGKIIHTNTLSLSEEVLEAVKELASVTADDLNKTILLSTGSEAVECALRYAKFYTKKSGVVGLGLGYHGLTLAAQSISSFGKYAVPKVQKTFSIPTPDLTSKPENQSVDSYINYCLEETEKQLYPYLGEIAAFVVEPVISVGGMIFPPRKYFKELKKIVEKHKALFIFDECQTGLGRTGKWFGYEHYGVIPDILVIAKAAGQGFPVSAVTFRDSVVKNVDKPLIHFSSHQNDPISGKILSFTIKHIKENDIIKKNEEKGKYFLDQLISLSKSNSWIKNPRGLGLMLSFDLPFNLFTQSKNPGHELISILEENGIIVQAIRQGKTFRILPCYNISEKEIDFFVATLEKCLKILKKY